MSSISNAPRIQKEIRDMMNCKDSNISASVNGNNLLKWKATIKGPIDSPYEGGLFKLEIKLPTEYPFQPPIIVFKTKIYHCNISKRGDICLDILKDGWSPALTIEKTLLSLITLLECPNPDDPLEPSIAKQMREDGLAYLKKAKKMTEQYAFEDNDEDNEEDSESDYSE